MNRKELEMSSLLFRETHIKSRKFSPMCDTETLRHDLKKVRMIISKVKRKAYMVSGDYSYIDNCVIDFLLDYIRRTEK